MELVSPQAMTILQLNNYVKNLVKGDPYIQNILVTGEISNLTFARSGHIYLTLKDKDASIQAVIWKGNAAYLKFQPEHGMKVLAFGGVDLYPKSGSYQFIIQHMEPEGLGALNKAFEQLKQKLEKEGLFDPAHKKRLPRAPRKIGVVTAPTAAAFQDVCNVLRRRWPLADVTLSPTLVQGADAPPQIVSALERLDAAGMDVILLIRGGGSLEDLWAFNDERVARAVYACNTPIITGVGHETDTTMVDFVSDYRAPTPSAAAEVCAPDRYDEMDQVLVLQNRMRALLQQQINERRSRVQYLQRSNVLQSFSSLLNVKRMELDQLYDAMAHSFSDKVVEERNRYQLVASRLSMDNRMTKERHRLSVCAGQLTAYNPLNVIARGYGVVRTADGQVVETVTKTHPGDSIDVTVSDGTLQCTVDQIRKEVPSDGR